MELLFEEEFELELELLFEEEFELELELLFEDEFELEFEFELLFAAAARLSARRWARAACRAVKFTGVTSVVLPANICFTGSNTVPIWASAGVAKVPAAIVAAERSVVSFFIERLRF